jgi:elongator complex protein 3
VQSLQDEVLTKNHRGHGVAATRHAFRLLRQAGFKIHAHWMPNLYGSSVEADMADYARLVSDPDFQPDELKLYPCSLIESAELMQYYKDGRWRPYSEPELLEVLTACFKLTPPYCRLTRVIRDIPSPDIVVGNKKTNFRQIVEDHLKKTGVVTQDIRAREIRDQVYDPATVEFSSVDYETSVSHEKFLQFTAQVLDQPNQPPRLLAFLRLSLPKQSSFISELAGAAMIREVHVYGRASELGERRTEQAQHAGFGTQLMEKARELATTAGFNRLAVISAVGTREYYRGRGFTDGELYQFLSW